MNEKTQREITDRATGRGRLPAHVAIIMDGNGRWATEKGLTRTAGHKEGVETVKRITEEAASMGISALTLYAFSTENWSRPVDEVAALMSLVLTSLHDELFMRNNIRFHVIGDIAKLPPEVTERLRQCERETEGNTRMTLTVALSYSSRWEITEAARRIAIDAKAGKIDPTDISEQTFSSYLVTADMPDPELLIRTGGELRLSNFLLWQSAYTELYFTPVYWPDFSVKDFHRAIDSFSHRQRRFGLTETQAERTNDNE